MQSIANLTLDSREVATMVEKRHDHLIRDIAKYAEHLTAPNFGASDFFRNSSYKDSSGKVNKCFLLTRKGCEFVANKMTGKKGILFTANYINRFHEMEKELMKNQAAKKENKPNYNDTDYYKISKELTTRIQDAVKCDEEASACLDAIVGIVPLKDIAPIRCLVQEYGRLIHRSADSESQAINECGKDNYERYRVKCREIRDFCTKNAETFKKEVRP